MKESHFFAVVLRFLVGFLIQRKIANGVYQREFVVFLMIHFNVA